MSSQRALNVLQVVIFGGVLLCSHQIVLAQAAPEKTPVSEISERERTIIDSIFEKGAAPASEAEQVFHRQGDRELTRRDTQVQLWQGNKPSVLLEVPRVVLRFIETGADGVEESRGGFELHLKDARALIARLQPDQIQAYSTIAVEYGAKKAVRTLLDYREGEQLAVLVAPDQQQRSFGALLCPRRFPEAVPRPTALIMKPWDVRIKSVEINGQARIRAEVLSGVNRAKASVHLDISSGIAPSRAQSDSSVGPDPAAEVLYAPVDGYTAPSRVDDSFISEFIKAQADLRLPSGAKRFSEQEFRVQLHRVQIPAFSHVVSIPLLMRSTLAALVPEDFRTRGRNSGLDTLMGEGDCFVLSIHVGPLVHSYFPAESPDKVPE